MIGGIISFLKKYGSMLKSGTVLDGDSYKSRSFDLQEWYESEAELENDIKRMNGRYKQM